MAKPNYQYEKRQRDLAKKKQKEEKLAKKRLKKQGDGDGEVGDELPGDTQEPAAND